MCKKKAKSIAEELEGLLFKGDSVSFSEEGFKIYRDNYVFYSKEFENRAYLFRYDGEGLLDMFRVVYDISFHEEKSSCKSEMTDYLVPVYEGKGFFSKYQEMRFIGSDTIFFAIDFYRDSIVQYQTNIVPEVD